MTTNIFDLFLQTVALRPGKLALSDGKHSVTFAEWLDLAERIGTAIGTDGSDVIRRPVMVFVDRCIDPLVAFMGVAASGNFFVPIDCKMPAERVKLIVETLKPFAAVTLTDADDATLNQIGFSERRLRYGVSIETNADAELLAQHRVHLIDLDPAYSIFTSGSTGVPKGVVMSHRGMMDFSKWLGETFKFTDDDVLGNQAPYYFDGAMKDICAAVVHGVTLQIIPRKCFSFPKLLISLLNEKRVTMLLWATSAVTLVANSGVFDLFKPQFVRCVAFGGESMPIKQLNVWRRVLAKDVRYINLYGPTETAVDATFYEVDREFNENESLPIGKACQNKAVIVLNEQDQLTVVDEPGELCIRGSGVALGYYNNSEKTTAAFVQNPLHNLYEDKIYRTGDIVKYNERGELVFVSRKDFQIKHMGNRIELGEIEAAVNAILAVLESACVYDKEREQIVLYYTTGTGEELDIVNLVKDKIPKYMYPNVSVCLKKMPHNANGKIDRVVLAQSIAQKSYE